MDSNDKKKQSDKEQHEEDSLISDLELSKESLNVRGISSAIERNAEAPSSSRVSPRSSAASGSSEASVSQETEATYRIPETGKYTSLIQRHRELDVEEDSDEDKPPYRSGCISSASSSCSSFSASGLSKVSPSKEAFLKETSPSKSQRRLNEDFCGRSQPLIPYLKETSPSKRQRQNEDLYGRLEPPIQTLKETSPSKRQRTREEDICGRSEPPISSLTQRYQEFGLKEKDTDHLKVEDRALEVSRTPSRREYEPTNLFKSYSTEVEGACGTSEPSYSSQTSLIQRYEKCNLLENTEQVRVQDRALDRALDRSSQSFPASSSAFEASLRASEGAIGLPGPFAAFIQRHRDFEDDSDDEQPEDRPVLSPERRQRTASASYRDSRSGSLGECSEESMSRSTSEASHSSGLPENKEASASESLPLQQQPYREVNPPDEDEDGATDEDEGDLEAEEQYQDSDSERKGYSL